MLYFKSCPRCKGDIHLDTDSYGTYAKCLQCGFSRDFPAKDAKIVRGPQVRTLPAAPVTIDEPDAAAA